MTGTTYSEPAFVFNSNTQDPYFVANPSQNVLSLGSVNDGSGIYTNAQLKSAFPTALSGQVVFGLSVVYQYNGIAWYYFTGVAC